MRHKSQHTQPVVDGNHHHAQPRQGFAIHAARAAAKAAAVNRYQHRPSLSLAGAGPDVERQAILAHVRLQLGGVPLRARGAKFEGMADALPRRRGLRFFHRSSPTGGRA